MKRKMKLELYIKDSKVDEVEVRINPDVHKTFNQRKQVIQQYCEYLKQKNRFDILITKNWHLLLIVGPGE
jgi:hypothetical protein